MHRYIYLLSTYILRKWALIIIVALGLLISGITISVSIRAATYQGISGLSALNPATYIMTFIFSSLFTVFIYTYTFKDGEKDGSELIILTKPITRVQIFLSKVVVIFMYVFVFSLLHLFLGLAVSFGDTMASPSQRTAFIFSYWFGVLFVQMLFIPIIILIGTAIGKIGTVVVTILITALLPISSSIVSAAASMRSSIYETGVEQDYGRPMTYKTFDASSIYYNEVDAKSKGYGVSDQALAKDENSFTYVIDDASLDKLTGQWIPRIAEDDKWQTELNVDGFDKYVEYLWYDTYVYFDVWYQWARFYNAFSKTNVAAATEGTLVKFEKNNSSMRWRPESGFEIEKKGEKSNILVNFQTDNLNSPYDYFNSPTVYAYTWSYIDTKPKLTINSARVNHKIDLVWSELEKVDSRDATNPDGLTNLELWMEETSLANRIWALTEVVEAMNSYGTPDISMSEILYRTRFKMNIGDSANNNGRGLFESATVLYKLISLKYQDVFVLPSTANQIAFVRGEFDVQETRETNWSAKYFTENNKPVSSQYVYVVNIESFMSTTFVWVFWLLVGMMLYGLSFWRYTRIDFK